MRKTKPSLSVNTKKKYLDFLLVYTKATQLILTGVQLDKFSTSIGTVKFLTYSDKNETLITSKYKKNTWIFSWSHTLH